jgi:hypothetical protein
MAAVIVSEDVKKDFVNVAALLEPFVLNKS